MDEESNDRVYEEIGGDTEESPHVWLPAQEILGLLKDMGISDVNRYFNCMMLSQGAITDEIRELLVRTAVALVCLKQRKQRIKTDWCEGEIVTAFHSATMECISGIKFECQLEVDRKTIKATFLVTNTLLAKFDRAKWLRDDLENVSLKTSAFN